MPDLISSEPPHADNSSLRPSHPTVLTPTPHSDRTKYPPRSEAVTYPPRTEAVRRALHAGGGALAADLVFLEAWESQAPHDVAATLRAAQIRRANRSLAAEIRAELRRGRPLSEAERAALGAQLAGN